MPLSVVHREKYKSVTKSVTKEKPPGVLRNPGAFLYLWRLLVNS